MMSGRLPLFLFLLVSLLFLAAHSSGTGIIVADDKKQTLLFNADSTEVIALATELSGKYDRVILHLGRSFVFRPGNIYSTDKSKANLKLFADKLQLNGTGLTLWFMDSFGKESFRELFAKRKKICVENLKLLETMQIPYDGLAVDLEWINKEKGNNNSRMYRTLSYLRRKTGKEKKIYFFASLHDSEKENIRRGYSLKKLLRKADSPIAMLYPAEEGFSLTGQEAKPNFSNERIASLKNYFQDQGWPVAVSLKSTWIHVSNNQLFHLKPLSTESSGLTIAPGQMGPTNGEYWTTRRFLVNSEVIADKSEAGQVTLQPGEQVYNFEINPKIVEKDSFLWEYFDLQKHAVETGKGPE